ncbi:MAG: hypothetical protein FJ265_07190 [Planctomycetes bacterium]|nr:hypothetical protein [Planctomycetota bacterium]
MSPAPPRPRRRGRRLLFGLVAVAIGFAGALLLVEIALRIYDPLQLPLADMRGFYRLDDRGRIETTPGWNGHQLVEGREVPVHTNALGLRGAEPGPKAAGEQRVLMVGDSYVWGMGVADGETIPARLEQQLHSAGRRVAVGNAGMFGTSPREWGYTLERFRPTFAPDVVVATMYVGNDVLDAMQEPLSVVDGWLMNAGPAGMARTSWRFRMMVTSRLWYHVERLLQNRFEAIAIASIQPVGPGISLAEALFLDRDPSRDAEQPFVGEVEAALAGHFRDFARAAQGLRSLVVLLPGHEVALRDYGELLQENRLDPALHQRGRGHARLARLLAAAGLEVIDLTDRILAAPDKRALYFAQDWHLSHAGCERVAGWLRPEIEARLR